MNSKRINAIISVVALAALVRLWSVGGGLWWIILVLLFFNWFIGATAAKSVEIESSPWVVRFWRRAQLLINCVCFFVSAAGILLSFR